MALDAVNVTAVEFGPSMIVVSVACVVDKAGRVTLRYLSRLHHIGLGTDYRGLPVHLLVANKNVRVIHEDGSLIRELLLDPTRDYQPLGTKSGPKPRVVNDVVRHVSTMS